VSRYRCVDAQKAAGFPVVAACDAAGVSASAFYAWATRCEQGPRAAEQAEAALVAEIRTIHADSAGTYGSPRVTHELRRRGWRVTTSGWSASWPPTASSAIDHAAGVA
jgi:putative transposase